MAIDARSHSAETAGCLRQWAHGLGYGGMAPLPPKGVTTTLFDHLRHATRTEAAVPTSLIEGTMRGVTPVMVANWLRESQM